jgi:hypothetical protein
VSVQFGIGRERRTLNLGKKCVVHGWMVGRAKLALRDFKDLARQFESPYDCCAESSPSPLPSHTEVSFSDLTGPARSDSHSLHIFIYLVHRERALTMRIHRVKSIGPLADNSFNGY